MEFDAIDEEIKRQATEEKRHGGAAFPQSGYDLWAPEGGMYLRDYFAAKAMQGMLACPEDALEDHLIDAYSRQSYRIADAMLKARTTI